MKTVPEIWLETLPFVVLLLWEQDNNNELKWTALVDFPLRFVVESILELGLSAETQASELHNEGKLFQSIFNQKGGLLTRQKIREKREEERGEKREERREKREEKNPEEEKKRRE